MKRALTNEEQDLISRVAEKLGGIEGAQLLADGGSAIAITEPSDASRIRFDIPGYERPDYRGQHSYGIEGKMFDRDGVEVTVLLHADENGRLLELEFIRWGEGNLIAPNWSSLKLY